LKRAARLIARQPARHHRFTLHGGSVLRELPTCAEALADAEFTPAAADE